jgi:hypothetical protein
MLREGRSDEFTKAEDPVSRWFHQRDVRNRFTVGAGESDIFLPGV